MPFENGTMVKMFFDDKTTGLGVVTGQPGSGICFGKNKEDYLVMELTDTGWNNGHMRPESLATLFPLSDLDQLSVLVAVKRLWKEIEGLYERLNKIEKMARGD